MGQQEDNRVENDVVADLLDYVRTVAWHDFLKEDVDGIKQASEVPHS